MFYTFLFLAAILAFVIYINQNADKKSNPIEILLRQTARWALAAEQDKSPLIAVLHANYAAGYLWALKDIASSEQVKEATGQDLKVIERQITSVQDSVTKRMVKLCPEFGGEANKLLAAIAGEGPASV